MVTKQILISHPIKTLKSEVSKTNIKGYSKMKKDEIIELMLKYKSRFSHIKKREQKPKEKQKKKPKIEIPEITITEAEPDKKKVFQRGGRFFKPKEIKSKLPPIPKTNIKIRLPKEKEKSDKEKVLEKFNLKVGDTIKLGESRGGLIAKIKELGDNSFKTDQKGGRFIYKNIVKNNYEDIEKNLGIKPKEKKKPEFKFNKDDVTIEIKKYGSIDKYEIEFFNQDENAYIEMTLRKGTNNILFLEHLSSQFDDEQPRAKKGYTRAMLCNLINMLVNKGLVSLKNKFGLVAGDIGGITGKLEKKHNLKNLTDMYKSMGFNKKRGAVSGQQQMESNVGNVLEWCNKTYDIKKEEIKQVQQNKNDISEKGLLKEYEKDFKGKTLDKSNIIRLIQPKQYNKLGKDLKLKNVFKLLNKVWDIVKKDYKTFGDIQNDNKSFEQLFKRNEKYLLGLSSVNDYRGNGISEIDPPNVKMFLKKYLM